MWGLNSIPMGKFLGHEFQLNLSNLQIRFSINTDKYKNRKTLYIILVTKRANFIEPPDPEFRCSIFYIIILNNYLDNYIDNLDNILDNIVVTCFVYRYFF